VAEVQLPQLGESVAEGIITAWLVAVGDTVTADQPIVEISTDKVDTEIPTPIAGTVTELRAAVDDTVQVGEVIAVIDPTGAPTTAPAAPAAPATPAPAATTATPAPASAPAAPAPAPTTPATRTAGSHVGVLTSPVLRRLIASRGLTPASVRGSGPGGRITRSDVLVTPAGSRSAALRGTTAPVTAARRAIAHAMTASLTTTAQLTSVVEADVTRLVRLRDARARAFRGAEGFDLTLLPLIAQAVCRTLVAHPVLNASIDTAAGTIAYHEDVNLGIAVETDGGLLVPNLRRAQDLDVTGLARGIADLTARARARSLKPEEVSGGTFTLTDTGSRGTLIDTPILNAPEVGNLAVGAVERRPVVLDSGDAIVIRWRCYLALTYDHRLVDGADAARVLTDLRDRLADPGDAGLPA
jgi:pyruvate dehydrogenase E2 component (dihydrolipoamide acetyltransferase)